MTYKISEYDGLTGENIVRNMTADEMAQYEADNVKLAQEMAEADTGEMRSKENQDIKGCSCKEDEALFKGESKEF